MKVLRADEIPEEPKYKDSAMYYITCSKCGVWYYPDFPHKCSLKEDPNEGMGGGTD